MCSAANNLIAERHSCRAEFFVISLLPYSYQFSCVLNFAIFAFWKNIAKSYTREKKIEHSKFTI